MKLGKNLKLIAAAAAFTAIAAGVRYLMQDKPSDSGLDEDFDDIYDDDFEDFEDDPQEAPAPVAQATEENA